MLIEGQGWDDCGNKDKKCPRCGDTTILLKCGLCRDCRDEEKEARAEDEFDESLAAFDEVRS